MGEDEAPEVVRRLVAAFKSQKIVRGCEDATRTGSMAGSRRRKKLQLEQQQYAALAPQLDDPLSAADSVVAYYFRDYHWELNMCLCYWLKLVRRHTACPLSAMCCRRPCT